MFRSCDLCTRTQDSRYWPLHPQGGERTRCRKCVEAKGHPPARVKKSLDPDVALFREELRKRQELAYAETKQGKSRFRDFYVQPTRQDGNGGAPQPRQATRRPEGYPGPAQAPEVPQTARKRA